MASKSDKHWKLTQVFSDDDSSDDESQITSLQFNQNGEFLAVGYNCGQIVVFTKEQDNPFKYKFYTQFESHSLEFDFLTSTEIPEKINKIVWSPFGFANNGRQLLSTNDKTVKLWKISEKNPKRLATFGKDDEGTAATATHRRTYANGHSYNIHSVSLNTDGETFISADDLRINLWNLNYTNQSFNVVDCKPENMEDLTEVITCADFHPTSCNLFVYGLSKGVLKLADMRANALCDREARAFRSASGDDDGFFSEMISSLHDVKFTGDGRHIITRDFMSLKVWDVNMERQPVKTISLHDHLRPKLYDLYENDYLFDKFDISIGHDNTHFVTGSYHNNFFVYDLAKHSLGVLEACKPSLTPKSLQEQFASTHNLDFTKKIQHIAWHPKHEQIAVATDNYIYLYQSS